MRKGTVFVADGLPKDTALDELKNFFADFCTVAWVEFKSGDEKVPWFFLNLLSLPQVLFCCQFNVIETIRVTKVK